MRDRVKRMLGFVLVATIEDPLVPPHPKHAFNWQFGQGMMAQTQAWAPRIEPHQWQFQLFLRTGGTSSHVPGSVQNSDPRQPLSRRRPRHETSFAVI